MTAPARRRSARRAPQFAVELGGSLEFLRTLWELDHALQRASKRMERERGVTGPQRMVVRIVGRFPRISPGQLATLLHLHPSTLTGVLQRLEVRRLIVRRVDPRDRRRSFLGLTPAGRALDVDLAHTVEEALEQVLKELPPARAEAARATLQALAEALRGERPVSARGRARAAG